MTVEFKPRPVGIEDIDIHVRDWFKSNDVVINSNGKETKLPILWLTQERWHEYKQNWKILDHEGNQNVKPPYITIRQKEITPSSNIRYRIPGKKFTTYKVPVKDGAGVTYDLYRVPQPIKIDIEYEFRFVSHYVEDKNYVNEMMYKWFASRQSYIHVHDTYWMPLIMDGGADESVVDDANQERLMMTTYPITAQGFLLDEKEFEIVRGQSRIVVFSETIASGTQDDIQDDTDNTGYSSEDVVGITKHEPIFPES
jgi:hypothetical protein